MELQQKICNQETMIRDLKSKHDNNLKYISLQLFSLQRSLMEKENHLSQLIREREQVAEWSTLIGREGRDRPLIGRELYRTKIFS